MKLSTFINIIQTQLNVESVKGTDSFKELGADSLDMVELVTNIEDELGIDLPDEIVDEDTVAKFYGMILKRLNGVG